VHGVGGHDAAFEGQQGEQLGHGRDLVGLAVDAQLAEHQALLAGPGADQMHGGLALLAVEGAARALAVDRHHALDARGERHQIAGEASLEGRGIEQAKDAREGVMARDATRQAQKAPQQRLLRAAEDRHVDAALAAGQAREQRDHDDVVELVAPRVAGPRIVELGEKGAKLVHAVPPSRSGAA
jgi:preprotein translocase subunit SecD